MSQKCWGEALLNGQPACRSADWFWVLFPARHPGGPFAEQNENERSGLRILVHIQCTGTIKYCKSPQNIILSLIQKTLGQYLQGTLYPRDILFQGLEIPEYLFKDSLYREVQSPHRKFEEGSSFCFRDQRSKDICSRTVRLEMPHHPIVKMKKDHE